MAKRRTKLSFGWQARMIYIFFRHYWCPNGEKTDSFLDFQDHLDNAVQPSFSRLLFLNFPNPPTSNRRWYYRARFQSTIKKNIRHKTSHASLKINKPKKIINEISLLRVPSIWKHWKRLARVYAFHNLGVGAGLGLTVICPRAVNIKLKLLNFAFSLSKMWKLTQFKPLKGKKG